MALSVGLPRPGVTRHRIFWESGLSSGVRLPVPPRSSSSPRAAGMRFIGRPVNGVEMLVCEYLPKGKGVMFALLYAPVV